MTPEKPYDAMIIFPDGSEGLLVTPVGPNLYRLEESSLLGEAICHDVIETELQTDGALRFIRVVTRSEFKTSSYVLSKSQIESPALQVFLDSVMAVGGNWERLFGGFLMLHLPPEQESRVLQEFNAWIQSVTG